MQYLLTLNNGSSSVKFRLFGLQEGLPLIAGGKVSGIGGPAPVFRVKKEPSEATEHPAPTTHEAAVLTILEWLQTSVGSLSDVAAVAHRVVHGGAECTETTLITNEVFRYLQSLTPLAPLHQPHNLSAVQILSMQMPGVPQYGCFDTAFHTGRAELYTAFALPEEVRSKGVQRYGFHGLSYGWLAGVLKAEHPHLHGKRVVAAHLGNGASLCAMQAGKSVDTTMGLTALDGLPMGTRSGAMDPGALLYMERTLGYTASEVEHMLYEESGLKGLSGISNDVKTLAENGSERARFALEYFVHKTAQHIASMAVSIGGLDALVFSGGIGENAPDIRTAILAKLAFLPAFEALVIPTNEERYMAQQVQTLLEKAA